MDKHNSKARRHANASSGDKQKSSRRSSQSHTAGHASKKKKRHKKRCDRPDHGKCSTSPEAECRDIPGGELDIAQRRNNQPASTCQVNLHVDEWPSGGGMFNKPTPSQPRRVGGSLSATTLTIQTNSQQTRSISLDSRRSDKNSAGRSASTTGLVSNSSVTNLKAINGNSSLMNNHSLRWEGELSDPEQEEERVRQYKLNRRKRYLQAANKNYDDWLASTGSCGNSSTSTSSDSATNLVKTGADELNAMYCSREIPSHMNSVPNMITSQSQRQTLSSC